METFGRVSYGVNSTIELTHSEFSAHKNVFPFSKLKTSVRSVQTTAVVSRIGSIVNIFSTLVEKKGAVAKSNFAQPLFFKEYLNKVNKTLSKQST